MKKKYIKPVLKLIGNISQVTRVGSGIEKQREILNPQ